MVDKRTRVLHWVCVLLLIILVLQILDFQNTKRCAESHDQRTKGWLSRNVTYNEQVQWEKIEPWLFVYSAIVHYAYHRVVVVAMAREESLVTSLIKCQFDVKGSRETYDAVPEEMWQAADIYEGAPVKFKAYLLICSSPVNARTVPSWVSVSLFNTSSSWLPVVYNPKQSRLDNSIVVCMKPFHHSYDSPWRVQEFIELMHLQGVGAFQFYIHTAGEKVKSLLRKYQSERRPGLEVNVMDWPLPLKDEPYFRSRADNPFPGDISSHDYGQYASMYDCWLRNERRHTFMAFLDVDEMPILYQTSSFQEYFGNHKHDYYMFRNAYFPINLADDVNATDDVRATRAVSLLKNTRHFTIQASHDRSKYFVRLGTLHSPGIHIVFRLRNHVGVLHPHVVPPDLGLLHHYRFTDPKDADNVKDTRAYRYRKKLLEAITSASERGLVWK